MEIWRRALLGWIFAGALAACGPQGERAPQTSDPCHLHLSPGDDDQLAVQSALLGAAPGSVICLDAGIYDLGDGLSLGVPGLTFRGAGEGAILDFSSGRGRAPGLEITGDDVTVMGLELRDPRGAAVRVMGADNVRIDSLRIHWTEPVEEKADGVALYGASNTRIRNVEVQGAPGFGLRAHASLRVVIEGSSLHDNEVGLWVEGGTDIEVTGTEFRSNRAGLVLTTDASGEGERAKIHGNLIEGSGSDQAKADGLAGLGIAVIGPFSAEIHENLVRSNASAGLFVLPGNGERDFFLTVRDNRLVGNGEGNTPDRDIVVTAKEASFCFEKNEGSILAEDVAIDSACPGPSLPSLSL